jgi:hypothetical protein
MIETYQNRRGLAKLVESTRPTALARQLKQKAKRRLTTAGVADFQYGKGFFQSP